MSFFEDASLVLIPSAQKTSKVYSVKPTDGTGDLTFTRSNDTATRVGPNGLIEKVRTNLALQSQSFATSAVWGTVNGTVTNNAGTAPDGTNTASKIVATDADPFVYQPLTLSGSVVVSCYVKGIGSSIGKTGSVRAASSFTTFTITGDWQRVSLIHTAGGAQNYGVETPESAAVSDEVLLWGFQVEYGDVATDYIATTSAAVSVGPVANVPRLDYLNSSCPRLNLEPQRTNLNPYSEQFDNAGWEKTYSTITANATTSPDGYTNADAWFETSDNNWHRLYDNGISVNSGTAYTCSLFVKANGRDWVSIEFFAGGGGFNGSRVWFNIANGTIGTTQTGITAKIENYGNGWYRISATQTAAASTTGYILYLLATGDGVVTYAGDPTKGAFVYGGMTEAGAYATSYIPTLGAAVTRGADDLAAINVATLNPSTNFSIYFEITESVFLNPSSWMFLGSTTGSGDPFQIYGGTAILNTSSGYIYPFSFASPSNTSAKVCLSYNGTTVAVFLNGVKQGQWTANTNWANKTTFDLSYDLSQKINYKQVLTFPIALSDADAIALTA